MLSLYDTQEPLDDSQLEAPLRNVARIDDQLIEEPAQAVATGSSPKFHVFYHSYKELYRRSRELLQYARDQVSDSGTGLLDSISDEIQNQKACISMFDEYLKNVWVQVYLDDSGSLQVSKLMSMKTTIQGLFSQLPRLAHNLLQVVLDNSQPLASSFQLRLVCDFPHVASTTAQNFDLPIHSSVTLEEIMHEYIPGTFQLSFRLLCQGNPVNLAALMLQQLEKSCHEAPQTGQSAQSPAQQQHQLPQLEINQRTTMVQQADHHEVQQIASPNPTRNGQPGPSSGLGAMVGIAKQPAEHHEQRQPEALQQCHNGASRQRQACESAEARLEHNETLSAQQLIESSLLLNLQAWDEGAQVDAQADEMRPDTVANTEQRNAAEGAVDGANISEQQELQEKSKSAAALHAHALRRSVGEDTVTGEPGSSGRVRKRPRVQDRSPAGAEPETPDRRLQPGSRRGRPQLPPHLVQSPVGPPPDSATRFKWTPEDVALLLKGIQSYGKHWSTIQGQFFPAHPGTSFQNKMKDKWRSLCQVLEKKHAARKALPEHLWQQAESLKKLHGML